MWDDRTTNLKFLLVLLWTQLDKLFGITLWKNWSIEEYQKYEEERHFILVYKLSQVQLQLWEMAKATTFSREMAEKNTKHFFFSKFTWCDYI